MSRPRGFPVLIYFGAGAIERQPKIGKALGDASYAIYAIHRPLLTILLWPLASFLERGAPRPLLYSVELGLVAVIAGLAWLINRRLVFRKG